MDLSALNEQQRAAVRHTEGPLLLLAGAGSGKTRVITSRIAFLLQDRGVPSQAILAVTFTNKAAREMRERVEGIVGRKQAKGMVISTFHALCVRILKEDIEQLGYKKNFSIYGGADQLRLIRDLLQEVNTGLRKFDADRVLWLISDAKNRLIPPDRFAPTHGDEYGPVVATIYPRYQRALKAFNAVDFDDLIMLTVRLLQDKPAVLEKYRQRFRYLMVDEYQDTNAAQYRLLRLLAEGHRNLCVVGDDDQSIYGWRGADLGNILDFEKDFPGTMVIRLEQNYRSTGNILTAANAVIRNNLKRKIKALWTADGPGDKIDYLLCEDDEDEARVVVERIMAERFKARLSYRDFAILFRTNVQSRAFEEQLRYQDVPYVLIGGQQFFDRKEVKDVLAYFRVLLNPRDEVNLLRILNTPKRGIGDTSADRLIRFSAEHDIPLWQVLKNPAEVEGLGDKVMESIATFVDLMQNFRRRFRVGQLSDTGRELLQELRFEDDLLRTAQDPDKARRRMANVAEVINAMASYEQREVQPTLEGFLDKVSLLDRDEPPRQDKDAKLQRDAVVLMSLHSSKGLEFPCVFLVGMEDELLPHKKSKGANSNIEEERRLCYVGITRAQKKLTLLGAARRKKFGVMQLRSPSCFLEEIPDEVLHSAASDAPTATTEEEKDQLANNAFADIKAMLDF
ncbi:ATP-dependent DNA helicase Rep [Syntrophotalea carbinolica DSM 2380]|uniref:DNA 3'-5' helicase n=1 Tax=Syntrophotalea carbinolica (strain DSM 2380 / NBRC 103641 / GraBd1) TaxID=338963 RepID=Q3A0B1_SYNC1|nr:UvrD-helicase domain-containing protein [Syntrophotalea carbinolica]ABA90196.1 ATP-dependent DNA helicase Rep [Syntrophotalea carbinolica DSM 2380]